VREFIEKSTVKKEEVVGVFGTSGKKKVGELLPLLEGVCGTIYLVEAQNSRACPI
jgi:hypothetical protein